jgi:hypothetical protein
VSEVSAVVLSVGEPYTQRAIDSLAAQTVRLQDIIVIENVSPFFRAINDGARQVRTPFFVQVDADMILDPNCVEVLLGRVRADSGIVVAELRDPLSGPTVGVKLFRTECFRLATMPDSLAQDTDFGAMLRRRGWHTHFVEEPGSERSAQATLGEHRPEYTPTYTYRKFLVEGARLRHRAARHGLFSRMGTLERSVHPRAVLAQLALGHGFFLRSRRDELRVVPRDPRGEWLAAWLEAPAPTLPVSIEDGLLPLSRHRRLRDVFGRFREAGHGLAGTTTGAACAALVAGLSGARRDSRALVAKVALGHGLLMEAEDHAHLAGDERAFKNFMLFSLGSRSRAWDVVVARAGYLLAARRRPHAFVPW